MPPNTVAAGRELAVSLGQLQAQAVVLLHEERALGDPSWHRLASFDRPAA